MYSMVLLMALSNGAATPAFQDEGYSAPTVRQANSIPGHQLYRHKRKGGGCTGGSCSGGNCCGSYVSYGSCHGSSASYGCSGNVYYGGCHGSSVSYGCTGSHAAMPVYAPAGGCWGSHASGGCTGSMPYGSGPTTTHSYYYEAVPQGEIRYEEPARVLPTPAPEPRKSEGNKDGKRD